MQFSSSPKLNGPTLPMQQGQKRHKGRNDSSLHFIVVVILSVRVAFCLENAKKCIFLPNLIFTQLVVKKTTYMLQKNSRILIDSLRGLSVRTGIVTRYLGSIQ